MLHDHGYKTSEVDTVHRRFLHTLIDIEIDILQTVIYVLKLWNAKFNKLQKEVNSKYECPARKYRTVPPYSRGPLKSTPKMTALGAKNGCLPPSNFRGRASCRFDGGRVFTRQFPRGLHEHGQGEGMVLQQPGFLHPGTYTVQLCR